MLESCAFFDVTDIEFDACVDVVELIKDDSCALSIGDEGVIAAR